MTLIWKNIFWYNNNLVWWHSLCHTLQNVIRTQKWELNKLSSHLPTRNFPLTQPHPHARKRKHGRSLTVLRGASTDDFNVVPETQRIRLTGYPDSKFLNIVEERIPNNSKADVSYLCETSTEFNLDLVEHNEEVSTCMQRFKYSFELSSFRAWQQIIIINKIKEGFRWLARERELLPMKE